MKKEYESPEMVIEYFTISSSVCSSGFGWEEEEEGYGYGEARDGQSGERERRRQWGRRRRE